MIYGLDYLTLVKYGIFAALAQIALISLLNLFYHPLTRFPGPKWAAASDWYKTYQEVYLQKSWFTVLEELHTKYGPIVRVGPNDLHFNNLNAYNEIYNNSNRWAKDWSLYSCFGEDRSSFGLLTYEESKKRKDVMNPLFSHRAICNLQDLVQSNVDRFCEVLKTENLAKKSSDLYFGFRCFTVDTVTSFCFAKSVDALGAPDFKAPLIEAIENSHDAFVVFKHFSLLRMAVFNMPPWLSVRVSPKTAKLLDLQKILRQQVNEVMDNPKSLEDAPHKVIYHELLNKEAYKDGKIPSRGSLYEEAQSLVFAGTDTVGNTLMVGTFYLLENKDLAKRLKEELRAHWADLETIPRYEDLQKLPFLTAVIKECLRITPGVTTPLPRIVPDEGAHINGAHIPAGASVGMSSVFVHMSPKIFEDPEKFNPDRWLQPDSAPLEKWLVPFSRGPRACMGQNLAWCELYLMFASLFRRFDMELDGTSLADLKWRDTFLPHFQGRHLHVFCQPVYK